MEIPLSEFANYPVVHEACAATFDLATALLGPGTLIVGHSDAECVSLLKARTVEGQLFTEGAILAADHPVARLLRAGQTTTVVVADIDDPHDVSTENAARPRSLLGVPVTLGDGIEFGVLAFVGFTPRDFTSSEVESMTALARLLRSAIDAERFTGYDRLTGLYTRSLFDDHLALELARSRRNGAFLAVLLMCFEFPKPDSGETRRLWLKLIAERLRTSVRQGDTVARVGAAEFALIVPDLRDLPSARRVAQSLLDSLNDPFVLADDAVTISPTIGVAVVPWDGHEPESLVSGAEAAMMNALSEGGGVFSFHSEPRHLRVVPVDR